MPSLYFHIPFCERKCLYCDFYSIESPSAFRPFLDALAKEIEIAGEQKGEEVPSVFFGGGTPSLLRPEELGAILEKIHARWNILPGAEITVETNPGTVDREKLTAFRALGINRLSIGIQSFDEDELRFLSRIHDARQAAQCVEDARAAGFENVSIDLIYSLPGQTLSQWRKTLKKGIELNPDHLSAYSLIVEENTPLAHLVAGGKVIPNSTDLEAELYQNTMEWMGEAGFKHYEISNYARDGRECRHNLVYWHHGNYLGFGPSAHSFEKQPGGKARRWGNIANLSTYVSSLKRNSLPRSFEETLDEQILAREFIFLGLRSDGLDIQQLRRDTGFDLATVRSSDFRGLLDENLAVLDGSVLRLTDRGYLLCDEIACRLMP